MKTICRVGNLTHEITTVDKQTQVITRDNKTDAKVSTVTGVPAENTANYLYANYYTYTEKES